MQKATGKAAVRYGVFEIDGAWLVCCEERRLGTYEDRSSAIIAGERAASEAARGGRDIELYVVGAGGEPFPFHPRSREY